MSAVTAETGVAPGKPVELPPTAKLMQMLQGSLVAQALYVAAELGIADLIKNEPQPVEALARQTETHARSLYRILRALAGCGVFSEVEPEVFALTPLAEPLVSTAAGSLHDAAVFMGANWHLRVHGEMMHSVRTGEPAWERVHGMKVYPYFEQHGEENEIFNRAMTSLSAAAIPIVTAANRHGIFANCETIVDIAGGHGFLLAKFLQTNTHLRGALFDSPEAIAGAPALFEREDVAERVEIVPGNFFASVPANYDVYMLKSVILDWDDAPAIKILSNIAGAMNGAGKVLIIESVIPDGNAPHMSKILDLEMLVSPGGAARNQTEFDEILAQAGLKLVRTIQTESPFSIIEAVKS